MKIAHCIWSFEVGGTETMLVDIVNEQSAMGHDVSLIIINDKYDAGLLSTVSEQVNITLLRRPPASRNPWHIIKLNRVLRRLNPDIIHTHVGNIPRYIIGHSAKAIFATRHGLKDTTRYLGRVDEVIAISEAVADDIKAQCGRESIVIPNGIRVGSILRRSTHELGTPVRVVSVGRLDHEVKGQDLLINAVAAAMRDNPNLHIEATFIGDGPSRQYLEHLAASEGIGDKVKFLGQRGRDYIYANLKDYDLMALTSRKEGFGLVVAEGLAAGLPVLVPDEGGPREVIDSGRYGTMFACGDAGDCKEKLCKMIDRYTEAAETAANAREYVNSRYSVSRQAAAYIKAYRRSNA